jgi:hypothetical protein
LILQRRDYGQFLLYPFKLKKGKAVQYLNIELYYISILYLKFDFNKLMTYLSLTKTIYVYDCLILNLQEVLVIMFYNGSMIFQKRVVCTNFDIIILITEINRRF